jgi:UDP-N-acetyl-D-glucosamine dehydrogenase
MSSHGRQIAAVLPANGGLESTTIRHHGDVVLPILAKSLNWAGFFWPIARGEDPGNPISRRGIPKVVGGWSPSAKLAGRSMRTPWLTSAFVRGAEACKIWKTYRSVNIAMVNELKMLFDKIGIDVWEVIDAAKTKPFGFQAFYPGPGLGGHCIPIDPFYLSWVARKHGMPTRFIELAGEINTSMPQYVVHRVVEALNDAGKPLKGSRICILGVAYKKDVDVPRESPSFS